MDQFELYRKFTRPSLANLLELLGLNFEYRSGEGDILKGQNHLGQAVEVFDFLGGYGSTILGHNHPEIFQTLTELQDKKTVFHAQASVRGSTAKLSQKLNEILQENSNERRRFLVTLGNSGAEAVEIALKHAYLEWQNKKRDLLLNLKSQVYMMKEVSSEIREVIKRFFDGIEKSEPVILAFRGGFHGKTAAAVAVTENSSYSAMYERKPISVHFLEREVNLQDIPGILEKFDFSADFKGQKIQFSRVVGLIYEPIQGEGGIVSLSSEVLAAYSRELKTRNSPLIADEIQSGLFRTGSFLASTHLKIQPDYILLGKSLGGSVSKIGATLIAEDHYQEEFGWVHTSTFAEDDWSSTIALKTIEILNSKKNEVTTKSAWFEDKIRIIFLELQKKFPTIVKAVRGTGFFLGIEFNFSEKTTHSSFLKFIFDNGYATYLFTSYLLHHHHIRVGVTLSAPSTLRLEPSLFITEEAIQKLSIALTDLCALLSERKMAALMAHLWKEPIKESYLNWVSDPATPAIENTNGLKRIGFLSHIINVDYIKHMERGFAGVQTKDLEKFLDLFLPSSAPALYHEQIIEGANGEKVILNLYGLMNASHQFENDLRNNSRETFHKVQEAVDLAAADGCDYFGLGQFTSIVSQNGLLLKSRIPITTGNSLTAGLAFRAIQRVIQDRLQTQTDIKIGVVGFTGNICLVVTQLLADLNYPMTLVYREPYATSDRFKSAVQTLLATSQVKMDQLTFAHQIDAIRDCDIILIGTNSSKEFIRSEHIKSGAAILDISVPTNVHEEVRKRGDVLYFQGGFARFPFDQKLSHIWTPTMGSKNWFACMSETLVCGLLGVQESFSLGSLSKARVLESLSLAQSVGVELGDLRRG